MEPLNFGSETDWTERSLVDEAEKTFGEPFLDADETLVDADDQDGIFSGSTSDPDGDGLFDGETRG